MLSLSDASECSGTSGSSEVRPRDEIKGAGISLMSAFAATIKALPSARQWRQLSGGPGVSSAEARSSALRPQRGELALAQ
uniref:Uncharacterized protein n=1 Tax=Knipowitschia caucasica TaxID=637954 RepID=A0AAV2L5Y6_KNICA